jgi:hypothetical protein
MSQCGHHVGYSENEHKLTVEDDLHWKMTLRTLSCPKVLTQEGTTKMKTAKDVREEDEMKI